MELVSTPPLNKYDFTRLRNMWETLVLDVVSGLIQRWEMCDCQDCILDVTALALNQLPAKYWVLDKYDVLTTPESFLKDSNNRRIAEESVLKALRLVEQNPHH
ncbi:hypothetical protein AUK22_09810 [bacterium CG2_30_54_10]|nr:MAG: hypothetical protein AUK22_09810 [bacterium CG2_30_54_10]